MFWVMFKLGQVMLPGLLLTAPVWIVWMLISDAARNRERAKGAAVARSSYAGSEREPQVNREQIRREQQEAWAEQQKAWAERDALERHRMRMTGGHYPAYHNAHQEQIRREQREAWAEQQRAWARDRAIEQAIRRP
jgi:hypothetical protein